MKYAEKMILVPASSVSDGSSAREAEVVMSKLLKSKLPLRQKWIKYVGMLRKFFNLADELRKPLNFISNLNSERMLADNPLQPVVHDTPEVSSNFVQYSNLSPQPSDDVSMSEYYSLEDNFPMSVSEPSEGYNDSIITLDNDESFYRDIRTVKRKADDEIYAQPNNKFRKTNIDNRIHFKKNLIKNKLAKNKIFPPIHKEFFLQSNNTLGNRDVNSQSIINDEIPKLDRKRKIGVNSHIAEKVSKGIIPDRRHIIKKYLSRNRRNKKKRFLINKIIENSEIQEPLMVPEPLENDTDVRLLRKRKMISNVHGVEKRNFTLPIDRRNIIKNDLIQRRKRYNLLNRKSPGGVKNALQHVNTNDVINKSLSRKRKNLNTSLEEEKSILKPAKMLKLSNILRNRSAVRPGINTRKRRKIDTSLIGKKWVPFRLQN
jgi:hypothetical protein